jgi:diacylglycerol kinase family enzyme
MSDAPARILVLLNHQSGTLDASGTGDGTADIAWGFAERGITADVRAVQMQDVPRILTTAERDGYAAVIAGGGDGTINAVANATSGTRLAFGVLPLGTHNHFAKDLGIPTDLSQAISMLADSLQSRNIQPMDVAEVNGYLFLNFSGIGLHPLIVEQREEDHAQIKRWRLLRSILHKFTKPLAFLVSFMRSLSDFPVHRLTLVMDGGRRRVRVTPAVIICTNVHQMEVFGVTELSVPRRGVLNTYIACTPRITGLVRLLLAALTRRLKALREFESLAGSVLTISTRRRTLHVSVDGEILRLQTPLRYRIRREALRVIGGTPSQPQKLN